MLFRSIPYNNGPLTDIVFRSNLHTLDLKEIMYVISLHSKKLGLSFFTDQLFGEMTCLDVVHD